MVLSCALLDSLVKASMRPLKVPMNWVESTPSSLSESAAFWLAPRKAVESCPSSSSESATLPVKPSFQASSLSFEVHVWPPSASMTRSTPLLLSRQAVMTPSQRDGMSAIAAPLAAISSASSATTIAGDGLGTLPKTPPKKVLIPAHLSFRDNPRDRGRRTGIGLRPVTCNEGSLRPRNGQHICQVDIYGGAFRESSIARISENSVLAKFSCALYCKIRGRRYDTSDAF